MADTANRIFRSTPHGNILIVGAYGTGNLGDETILSGMLDFLTKHEHYDKSRIVVFSRDPTETAHLHNIRARRRNIIDLLFSGQIMIGGGQLLQDLGGMALKYSALALVAKLLGKRVAFYGVGVGTMRSRIGRFLTKISSNTVDEIYVRDVFSRNRLMRLGVGKRINVCKDMSVYAPHVSDRVARSLLQEEGIESTNSRLLIALIWQYGDSKTAEALARFLPGFVQYILKKFRETYVIFVPFNRHKDIPSDQDIIYGDWLERQLKTERFRVLRHSYTPSEVLGVFNLVDVVISTRLHPLLFACRMNSLAVGIGLYEQICEFGRLNQIPIVRPSELDKLYLVMPGLMRQARRRKHLDLIVPDSIN
jgi:polysaccharide pyruvyl transferase WcaK-like protein